MTAKEIVAKWIGTALWDEPVVSEVTASIMAGMEADIDAVVAEEREACAKLIDEGRERITANNYQADVGRRFAEGLAAQIRARSERTEVG
jgi:hypothetical protein